MQALSQLSYSPTNVVVRTDLSLCHQTRKFGGARRDRTVDLLHAMQALSQLSYSPTNVVVRTDLSLCHQTRKFGGARRDRTVDLLHAMQALSQLSYSPNVHIINCVNGAHDMKPLKKCQRLIQFLALSAEKAAKSVSKQHDKYFSWLCSNIKKGGLFKPP